MNSGTRKHYIDNLRWMILLILIPFHTAMAWNVWGEPNYIIFEGNRFISSIVVFFSPYFMPLLFVLAGISTRFALQKRTIKEYLIERVKRLFVPFLFGIIVLMPIMSYIADKFNCSYSGGFFQHYAVFFTKFTDLTGADGGFSLGQFWFLLYLMIISVVSVGALSLMKKINLKPQKSIPFWLIFVLGLALPLLHECLSIGGKSLAEYTYLFLLGYFVFADEKTVSKAEKNSRLLLGIGLAATILNVYLFIWADKKYTLLNGVTNYLSEWIMVIALIGLAKRYLNFTGKVSEYMRKRSFLFYTYHFIWVVLFQYLLYAICGNCTFIMYIGTLFLSYIMTFVCCEISIKIPFLCYATGTKYSHK
ncbi:MULTISPECIES: acyltransferase family protein [unclassified Ruminococcus]|uniref:acyltransferase family protein n=1 Tax=unclassified Ruminococcus TaxID=2608920 RepID=UPI00210F130B|nr:MULTISPECIES: acyltransferase family protein [unclassified Ruminococcus]MCQ4023263.1 acyltransferase family protein [Ruminococcus sp. zg-924]MCQ4115048.1 acyltransferase family protein [Ruminococcus sp. zg-921]